MAPGGRTPRRRWSRRGGGGAGHLDSALPNPTLTAKSMLDLRLLDSFQEGAEPEEQGLGDTLAPPMRQGAVGAGLSRANQELGSTVSLQVTTTTAWVSHLSQGAGVLSHKPSDGWHCVVHPRPITGQTLSSCPIRARMWRRSVCCMPTNGKIAELAFWTGTTHPPPHPGHHFGWHVALPQLNPAHSQCVPGEGGVSGRRPGSCGQTQPRQRLLARIQSGQSCTTRG